MIPSRISPRNLILIGLILVVLGFVLPFMVVLKFIENSFLLSFLAYGAQVSGLMLGIIGAANYSTVNRRNKDDDTDW
ncbi:MAG: hypothetical protein HYZ26_03365 [Chloroflexi bacterium]|nr:hypothetical protein [Chloroflexota bacterium]